MTGLRVEIAVVALFSVATAVALVARRFKLPYTVALVIAGLALGTSRAIEAPVLTKDLLYAVFLPGLLFEAAFHLEFKRFWQNKLAVFCARDSRLDRGRRRDDGPAGARRQRARRRHRRVHGGRGTRLRVAHRRDRSDRGGRSLQEPRCAEAPHRAHRGREPPERWHGGRPLHAHSLVRARQANVGLPRGARLRPRRRDGRPHRDGAGLRGLARHPQGGRPDDRDHPHDHRGVRLVRRRGAFPLLGRDRDRDGRACFAATTLHGRA